MDLEMLTRIGLCGCVAHEKYEVANLECCHEKGEDEKEPIVLLSSLRSRMHCDREIHPTAGIGSKPREI